MTTRKCYQCGDGDESLDAIRERRNEEIRAWGRQVLADADAALKGDSEVLNVQRSDWDVINVQPSTPEQEPVEVEVEEKPHDVLALTEPQETEEVQAKVDKPADQANVAEHQNVDAATEETPAEAEEALTEEAEEREEESPNGDNDMKSPNGDTEVAPKPAAKKASTRKATTKD